jgi:hypothetical protein
MSAEEIDALFDSLMETVTEVNQTEESVHLKVPPTEHFVKISIADANKLLAGPYYIAYRMKGSGTVYVCRRI